MIGDLKKGNESVDPVSGKQAQLIANIVAIVVSVIMLWIKKNHSEIMVIDGIEGHIANIISGLFDYLTTGISLLFGLINYYFTVATTKKIGVLG